MTAPLQPLQSEEDLANLRAKVKRKWKIRDAARLKEQMLQAGLHPTVADAVQPPLEPKESDDEK
jgi:hypothetical protein